MRSYDYAVTQRKKKLVSKSQPTFVDQFGTNSESLLKENIFGGDSKSNANQQQCNNAANKIINNNNYNNNVDNNSNNSNNNNVIGPLGAFTAESLDVLRIAQETIDAGRELRLNSKSLIKESIENSKMHGGVINETLQRKIEETLALSVRENQKKFFFLIFKLLNWKF